MAVKRLRRWVARHDAELEALLVNLPEDVPFVLVEHASRYYPVEERSRVERYFMRFGGISPEESGGFEDEDDADDDVSTMDEEGEYRDSGTLAVADVSFSVRGGECVALVGPAECGKSTVLEMIAGLCPLSEGKVVVRGRVLPVLEMIVGLIPRGMPMSRALPVAAGFMRVPPAYVRDRMPAIAALGEEPHPERVFSRLLKSRRREELYAGGLLALEGDVVLVDLKQALSPGDLRDRYAERIRDHVRGGAAVIVTSKDVEDVVDLADRVLFMDEGRVIREVPVGEARAFAATLPPSEDPLVAGQKR